MAGLLANMVASQFVVFIIILSPFGTIQISGDRHDQYARTMDPKLMGLKGEKLTHFRFYFHDIYTGRRPTAVPIVASPVSVAGFGSMSMIDNPLTVGTAISSKLVARAQGFYGSASQEELALIVVMNFVFTRGMYNGSTVAVLGRNEISSKVREMPVVGGTGVFRFARGYVQAKTYSFNQTTGDAVVEYNAYVLHY